MPQALALQPPAIRFDKLGLVIAGLGLVGLLALPLMAVRATRIAAAQGTWLADSLPLLEGTLLATVIAVTLFVALVRAPVMLKVGAASIALVLMLVLAGRSAVYLTPEGNTFARVAPGAGFWVLAGCFGLMVADGLVRLKLVPVWRIVLVVGFLAALLLLIASGALSALSVMKEYANRADVFWREGQTHLLLAFGSLAVAVAVGVPLGIAAHRTRALRAPMFNILNMVQTIPSIALFGLLIAPLAWLAANVPLLEAMGVSGIGATPALVALFLYSLLPVVANTFVGLQSVPEAANDAARGMGMTDWQRLFGVELPLAFPVILTGIRIVLVQNIGLATIAALIGGGGFGVFVFQGIGQTAMDLVLLGAVPTVALAIAAAIVLDALVDMTGRGARA